MAITFSKQASYACEWPRHSHQVQVNNRAKHAGSLNTAPVSWKHTGYQPGLCRGPTPPCRGVVPMASFKSKVGKTWVSLWRTWRTWSWGRWMQDHNLLQKSEISCHEFKTWTWVPIQEGHARTNTKTWFSFQTFGSKRDLLQEHMKNHFLFPKPTSNRCMACKTDSIMQCS